MAAQEQQQAAQRLARLGNQIDRWRRSHRRRSADAWRPSGKARAER
jgi:hypothetical protein